MVNAEYKDAQDIEKDTEKVITTKQTKQKDTLHP